VTTSKQITIIVLGILISIISLWYGQNHGLMPAAVSPEAEAIDDLFQFMMIIATGFFLLIEGLLIYMAIRFRRKPDDNTDAAPVEGNVPLEIVWTAIPTVIILILSVYSFEVYNSIGGLNADASQNEGSQPVAEQTQSEQGLMASASEYLALGLGESPANKARKITPLSIDVNAIQYAFLFTYPDSGIVTSELHVPVGTPIQLNISAGDVLHAFWVPELRLKQDAIPAREAQLSFTPEKKGTYSIICAELCGPYHGAMKTNLIIESQQDYEAWLQQQQVAQSESLDHTVALDSSNSLLTSYTNQLGVNEQMLDELKAHSE